MVTPNLCGMTSNTGYAFTLLNSDAGLPCEFPGAGNAKVFGAITETARLLAFALGFHFNLVL